MLSDLVAWMSEKWALLAIPVAVFLAVLIAGLWLRRMAYSALGRWAKRTKWAGDEILVRATRAASILWCLIIAIYLALEVSAIPPDWKLPARLVLLSLLVISLALAAHQFAMGILELYLGRLKVEARPKTMVRNITTAAIVVVALLIFLEVWGVPTSPILLIIGIVVVVLALAFRDTVPNLFGALQLSATGQIKAGDYIRLETGEEGYVMDIGWRQTSIKAPDESLILIPNNRLVHTTVINYGRPLKTAKEPFHFSTRSHLKELTGLKAGNLWELVDIMKKSPDSVIYYHTHHFLEEHHYLTPEPANDFALWVSDVLGDEVLGEKLASVDTFSFASLAALRERLVSIIEEHLATETERRNAPEGREFYFMKAVSVVMPTPYLAHDLREFAQVLHLLSLGSLYYHIFEARLRLGRPTNDFSIWLERSLDEGELAERVSRLDPYNYTLEGLRSTLIQLIEKRIK